MADPALPAREIALVDLLDRVIDRGVVLRGDLTLSIAGVDLLFVGVQLVLCSMARLQSHRHGPGAPPPEAGYP